jgi:hypothetical protein
MNEGRYEISLATKAFGARHVLAISLALAVASATLINMGCDRPVITIHGNESLRLNSEQIRDFKVQAQNGDAEAAHKLWLHYEFVEYNHDLGEYWLREYQRLEPEQRKNE